MRDRRGVVIYPPPNRTERAATVGIVALWLVGAVLVYWATG